MVELQERDIGYLKLLARFGVLNRNTVDRYYGSIYYTQKRKKRLADEGYIKRNHFYSWLGLEGIKYLETQGVKIRNLNRNRNTRIRIAKIADTILQLEDVYICCPSWEIKSELLTFAKLYYGTIQNRMNGNNYYIYDLGKMNTNTDNATGTIKLKENLIKRIQYEIVQNAQNGQTDRIIIFAGDKETLDLYKKNMKMLNVKEQLLIPDTIEGIKLLKIYGANDVDYLISKKLFGSNLNKNTWNLADYSLVTGENIFMFIKNDLEKLIKLKNQFKLQQFSSSNKMKLIVVCLSGQEESVKIELPGIEIKTVNLEDLV